VRRSRRKSRIGVDLLVTAAVVLDPSEHPVGPLAGNIAGMLRTPRLGTRRLAALVALALAGAATASANGDRAGTSVVADSRVTISIAVPLYHGRVRSTYAVCKRDRTVVLLRVRPGRDQKIGRDRSNRRGGWRIRYPVDLAAGDRFYARVRPKEVSAVGTGLSCTGARSRTVRFVGE
jgi:hypothetical protein